MSNSHLPCRGREIKEMEKYAFYYCRGIRLFWDHVREVTARINPKQLVLLDVGYVVDSFNPLWKDKKWRVSPAILAVAWVVICTMQQKGLCDGAKLFLPRSDLFL